MWDHDGSRVEHTATQMDITVTLRTDPKRQSFPSAAQNQSQRRLIADTLSVFDFSVSVSIDDNIMAKNYKAGLMAGNILTDIY